jgi:hypothetical protein
MSNEDKSTEGQFLNENVEEKICQRSAKENILKLAEATTALNNRGTKSTTVRRLIQDSALCDGLSAADIFDAAYGDPDGREYWRGWLSRRTSAYDFSRLLTIHLIDQMKQPQTVTIRAGEVVRSKATLRLVLECLTSTLSRSVWLTPDGMPPNFHDTDQKGMAEQGFRNVFINPREATAWMLSDPASRQFVPDQLRLFLEREAHDKSALTHGKPEKLATIVDPPVKTRRGALPKYDWEKIKQETFRLMYENGGSRPAEWCS